MHAPPRFALWPPRQWDRLTLPWMGRWFLWLILLGLMVACTSPNPPPTSTELTLYTFAAYVPDALLEGFEAETGIQVTVVTYNNNDELVANLTANPEQYDVVIPTDYTVERLINADALLPLDLARIPNYNNIEKSFLTPYFDPGGATAGRRPAARNKKYSLPFQWGTTGIAYDRTKVAEPITRWADLWRPDLQGHLVVVDDARELMGMALLVLGYDKNSTDPTQLAAARDKLASLTPGIVAYDSDDPETLLLKGEAWVAVLYNGNAALASQANPNMGYVLPSEGAGIWFDSLAIPRAAPHADAAHAFINYVLEPANSLLITKAFPYSNPNQAALAQWQQSEPDRYQAYMANPITNPSPDVLATALLIKNVDDATAELYTQYWTTAKEQAQ